MKLVRRIFSGVDNEIHGWTAYAPPNVMSKKTLEINYTGKPCQSVSPNSLVLFNCLKKRSIS